MSYLEDDIYQETKAIKQGKRQMSPLLQELADWFRQQYAVKILNIQFKPLFYAESDVYELNVIVDRSEDYQKMYQDEHHPDANAQTEIAQQFRELARKYAYAAEDQLVKIQVTYRNFREAARAEVNRRAGRAASEHLSAKYAQIWKIEPMLTSTAVFYYTEADKTECQRNGISQAIAKAYYEILKEHDDLKCYTRGQFRITFDSKEHLEAGYDGKMQDYFR